MIYWTTHNELKPLIKRMASKPLLRGLFAMALGLLGTKGAHAEGGCPSGMQPYQPSPNRYSCMPIPGYGQQKAQRQAPIFQVPTIDPVLIQKMLGEHKQEQLQVKKELIKRGLTEKEVEALKEGSWVIYQEGEPRISGQKCNAVWVSAEGAITIGTSRGLNDPALLIYTSDKIPKSKKQVPVTVHINENGEEWDVQAVRYTLPNSDLGSIFISLRSLKAAIGDIKDTGHVKVDVDGKEMIDISWKNGLEAKKKLAQCAKS